MAPPVSEIFNYSGVLVLTEYRDPAPSPDISASRDEEALVRQLTEETALPFLPIPGYRIRIYQETDFANLGDKIDFLAYCKRHRLWAATIEQYKVWLRTLKPPWLHARRR